MLSGLHTLPSISFAFGISLLFSNPIPRGKMVYRAMPLT